MKPDCVLFDFDGVIADTESSNARYLGKALAVFGVAVTPEDERRMVGVNDREILEELLQREGYAVIRAYSGTVERLLEERRRQGNTYENEPSLSPMPGLLPFLWRLRAAGIRTALVTSTSSRLILAALNRMGMSALFDAILCGDMVEKRKPSPEGYQKAMALLGAAPERSIVIEDSPVGIRAGKSAGALVAAYKCGSFSQNTSQADFEIWDYEDCLSLPIFGLSIE